MLVEIRSDHFNEQYLADAQLGKIASLFSLLTIFIACLGLLGLAAYTAEQRTKEIGIRKVFGASIAKITALLSSGFIKLVFIANITATYNGHLVIDRKRLVMHTAIGQTKVSDIIEPVKTFARDGIKNSHLDIRMSIHI